MSLNCYLTNLLLELLPKKTISVKLTQTAFWPPSGKNERKLPEQFSWSSVPETKYQLSTKIRHVQKEKILSLEI